ncbi:MAG: sensor histidine kinase [Lachnospiraceae bacterium]|nr:sensor histidine kinase [Lachnospiraceae bacterium]
MDKKKRRYSLRNRMIRYNLTLMISVLILCGVIFTVSVGLIVGSYVQSDIDFLLTATADAMESGISFCSDVVTKVRKSEILMDYLVEMKHTTLSEDEKEELEKEFEKQVSISSQNIQGTGVSPLVEKVYLFDNAGNYISSTYYAMTYTEIEKSNSAFEKIYNRHETEVSVEKDYGYYPLDEKSICLLFPILDDRMDQVGSILYQIDHSALEYIMRDIIKYEDSFWNLCERDGKEVYGQNTAVFSAGKELLWEKFSSQPFEVKIANKGYQIHRRSIGMNLELFIGIPQNHLFTLLYDSIRVYAIAIAIIAAAASVALIFLIYQMTRPIKEVTDKLTEVKTGKFDTKLPDYDSAEFHEISRVFNEMTAYIDNLIKQVYEKQLSIKDMEMKFLQTQMNPHFMFNVLNTIALQAQLDGNQDVYRMITSFSQLIQAKIYRDTSEKVRIRQELEYVNYYLYLQNYRYGDRLQYKINIHDETLTEYYIPKLCIQLIVENAVVHGIEPKIGKGLVQVNIYEDDQKICIDTEDNGVGFSKEGEINLPLKQQDSDKHHNHVGLNNAHHIIKLMYGEPYGIRVFSTPGKGSKICIRIPFDDGKQEKLENDL